MRKLSKPTEDIEAFYRLCVNGVGEENKKFRLNKYTENVLLESQLYEFNSDKNELYKTVERFNTIKKQATVNYVTKGELTELYTNQMAKKNRPGRRLYDSLMKVPRNKRCPFCSVGRVKNLDHFLPKSQLPIFSILPSNLVPSCRDCNQDKGDGLSPEDRDQTLHPYFDDVSHVQWLFAKVIEGDPMVIEYYVDTSMIEDVSLSKKVIAHFKAYNLADIFSELAAEELNQIYFESRRLFLDCGPFELKKHLLQKKESGFKSYKNSWQVALYQSLALSQWYFNGEFITDPPVEDSSTKAHDKTEVNPCPICKGKVTFDCPCCKTGITDCKLCHGLRFLTSSNCPKCKGLGSD